MPLYSIVLLIGQSKILKSSIHASIHIKNEMNFFHILNLSLCLIFHISDFHNLKIVNNIFFFIFKDGLIFSSKGVYGVSPYTRDPRDC